MKNAFSAIILSLALAGCSSYSELARWDSSTETNGGEVPIASFVTQNFSYRLLGLMPLCTGVPWTEGSEDVVDDFSVHLFSDKATADNNLVSLRHALEVAGSNRITALDMREDDHWAWSLFLVKRHEVRTKCIILKPAP
ncbi:MAG: hypothetical protein J6W80_06615 [Kiritimatiellae bacterium]|nr:hypothetical protein [Kiritimatiellia bacterium]